MFAVQDDWIQYEAVPARRMALRGGATSTQRVPVVSAPALRERGPAPAPRAPRTGRRRLRLTRRGRVVLVVLPGLLALSGALVALSGAAPAEAAPATPAPVAMLVVRSGDTLWSVARRLEPGRDPRDVVAALQRANGLAGSAVAAGEVLRLPVGS